MVKVRPDSCDRAQDKANEEHRKRLEQALQAAQHLLRRQDVLVHDQLTSVRLHNADIQLCMMFSMWIVSPSTECSLVQYAFLPPSSSPRRGGKGGGGVCILSEVLTCPEKHKHNVHKHVPDIADMSSLSML